MKRVDRREAARGEAVADDLAAVVHRGRVAEAAAEGAEVDHPAPLRPRERMFLACAGAVADDLAAAVHRSGRAGAGAAAEDGEEVDQDAALGPRGGRRRGVAGARGG